MTPPTGGNLGTESRISMAAPGALESANANELESEDGT
jgi:hypothetical protein